MEKFEDTTRVIRSGKTKKGRQYNNKSKRGQKNNGLQNNIQKTKD